MPLRWHIDVCTPQRIAGWVDDDGPVDAIEIAINGRRIAAVSPRDYRQDLEEAGFGDGRRSFDFAIAPYLDEAENIVTLSRGERLLHTATLPLCEAAGGAGPAAGDPADAASSPSHILFLQTADPARYRPVLEATSRTVIEYCSRHRYGYQSFIGICRGYRAWHATFNRITLLRNIVNSGFSGWVCYLDADAFIADLDFDLAGFLADKSHIGFIAASDRPHVPDRPYWLVNAGTFLVNLGNPPGRDIVLGWAEEFDAISDAQLRDIVERDFDHQPTLQRLLQKIPGGASSILTLGGEPNLINYSEGLFIRQIPRSAGTFEDRLALLRRETDRILGRPVAAAEQDESFVRSLYRALVMREPQPAELAVAIERIRAGGFDAEAELRRCLGSAEFRHSLPQFLEAYGAPPVSAPLSAPLRHGDLKGDRRAEAVDRPHEHFRPLRPPG